MPYRRMVGDTEGLRKYPGEPEAMDVQAETAPRVSSAPKERRALALLAGGWVLMSASLAGIARSPWWGLLALSVGILIAGALEVYDLATPEEKPR